MESLKQSEGAAFRELIGIRRASAFEISLLKPVFQPQHISAWKAFRIGVPLPRECERKLIAVFGRQEVPMLSESLCYT
jgi:hypothetical protein